MISWTDDDLDVIDNGADIDLSAPAEVLQQWAVRAANSFEDLEILITGIDSKVSELLERRNVLAERKTKRADYLLKYVSQLPDKTLLVGVDKFLVKESKATKVSVIDASQVPVDFCKYSVKTNYAGFQAIPAGIDLFGSVKVEPDLTAIKTAIDSGVSIAGTEIVPAKPTILRNGKGLK